jgi:putative FmdB family regulatory protein
VPTYQYACTECGGQIEAVQKFTDDPLTVHEACGGRLRKVFSPVGIVFKGSGFYRTDSRSGSASSSAAASSSSSPSSGGASDSSSSSSSSSEKGSSPEKGGGEKSTSSGSSSAGSSSTSTGAKVA